MKVGPEVLSAAHAFPFVISYGWCQFFVRSRREGVGASHCGVCEGRGRISRSHSLTPRGDSEALEVISFYLSILPPYPLTFKSNEPGSNEAVISAFTLSATLPKPPLSLLLNAQLYFRFCAVR